MLALGYKEYGECGKQKFGSMYLRLSSSLVTQGGDWGFNVSKFLPAGSELPILFDFRKITREIARQYGGKHAKAWHVNFLEVHGTPSIESNLYTPFEKEGLERLKEFMQLGSGYNLVQSTKPQTLGYSLADSPVGLLAWIYEKLVAWADNYPWTDDEGCTLS